MRDQAPIVDPLFIHKALCDPDAAVTPHANAERWPGGLCPLGAPMISIFRMPKMGGRLRRHGYHWSMRPMAEAQMVGEENPVSTSAEEHCSGTRGTS